MNLEQAVSIDWISGTFFNKDLDHVIKILDLQKDSFIPANGYFGYRKSLIFNSIKILYDGSKDMGIHIVIPSAGIYHLTKKIDIFTLLYRLHLEKIELSRLDLALDVYKDLLGIITTDIENHNYRTRARKITEIYSRDTSTNEIIGKTIYIGSRNSETLLRIYDKRKEARLDYDCTRFELELKDKKAKITAKEILHAESNFSDIVKTLLKNHVKFVMPTNDGNKARWPLTIYWQQITNTDYKIKFKNPSPPKSIEATIDWLIKCVSPSLAKSDIATGQNGLIDSLLYLGSQKLSESEIEKATQYYHKKIKGVKNGA